MDFFVFFLRMKLFQFMVFWIPFVSFSEQSQRLGLEFDPVSFCAFCYWFKNGAKIQNNKREKNKPGRWPNVCNCKTAQLIYWPLSGTFLELGILSQFQHETGASKLTKNFQLTFKMVSWKLKAESWKVVLFSICILCVLQLFNFHVKFEPDANGQATPKQGSLTGLKS